MLRHKPGKSFTTILLRNLLLLLGKCGYTALSGMTCEFSLGAGFTDSTNPRFKQPHSPPLIFNLFIQQANFIQDRRSLASHR